MHLLLFYLSRVLISCTSILVEMWASRQCGYCWFYVILIKLTFFTRCNEVSHLMILQPSALKNEIH